MQCNDGPGCYGTRADVCKRFESVRNRCPLTCKSCSCRDLEDCQGITKKHCDSIPETLHKHCAMTCGICGNYNGKISIKFTRQHKFFMSYWFECYFFLFLIFSKLHWQKVYDSDIK